MELRNKVKSFIAGFLVCAVLLTGVFALAAPGAMRELLFGINVVVNGETVDFDYDSRPFVIEGRTFLPVRALADVLGWEVDWDGYTQTVYLSELLDEEPWVPEATPGDGSTLSLVNDFPNLRPPSGMSFQREVTMHGQTFSPALVTTLNGAFSRNITFAIDGQFSTLTATVGADNLFHTGTAEVAGIIRFYDGNLRLAEYVVVNEDLPLAISVDVTGVENLRISVLGDRTGARGSVIVANPTVN